MLGFTDTGLRPGTHTYRLVRLRPVRQQLDSATPSSVTDDHRDRPARTPVTSSPTARRTTGASASHGHDRLRLGRLQRPDPERRRHPRRDRRRSPATDNASTFDGTRPGSASTRDAAAAPNTFTAEAWFKTTITAAARSSASATPTPATRATTTVTSTWTTPARSVFGVYTGTVRTVNSLRGLQRRPVAPRRRHAVGATGMVLYVDGKQVGPQRRRHRRPGLHRLLARRWRQPRRLAGKPSSNYFAGAIDDVAIYPTALTSTRSQNHYIDSGRHRAPPQPAPADTYGKAVYDTDRRPLLAPRRHGRADGGRTRPATATGTYSGGVTYGVPARASPAAPARRSPSTATTARIAASGSRSATRPSTPRSCGSTPPRPPAASSSASAAPADAAQSAATTGTSTC